MHLSLCYPLNLIIFLMPQRISIIWWWWLWQFNANPGVLQTQSKFHKTLLQMCLYSPTKLQFFFCKCMIFSFQRRPVGYNVTLLICSLLMGVVTIVLTIFLARKPWQVNRGTVITSTTGTTTVINSTPGYPYVGNNMVIQSTPVVGKWLILKCLYQWSSGLETITNLFSGGHVPLGIIRL